MNKKIDFAAIKNSADIVEVIGRFVKLEQVGPHYIGICPFHNEDTGSFKVTPKKKIFKCFGCGKGGDVFDFMELRGMTKKEAALYIGDPNNTAAVPHGAEKEQKVKKEKAESKWKQVLPAVKVDGMYKHRYHGEPNATWDYFDRNGVLMGCVCRFDLPKKKEVLPLIYATDGKIKKWQYLGFDKPRPLYNWHILEKQPTKSVIVVEGEKTAEAAMLLFPKTNVTTWMGGAQGVKHADWTPLLGRIVVLWPDNDGPGFDAMQDVYDIVKTLAEVKWVVNPADAEKGWDVADSSWTPEEAKKYSSKNIIPVPARESKALYIPADAVKPAQSVLSAEDIAEIQQEEAVIRSVLDVVNNPPTPPNEDDPDGFPLMGTEHFRMLGARKEGNGMMFNFYAYSSKTVIGLTPSSMTKNNLMQLAPFNWWKNSFGDGKGSISVDRAANYLINKSAEMGTFSEKWLRGRGAWVDEKRVVIHAGDKLFINGKETALSKYQSKYIYEVGEPMGFSVEDPLVEKDASQLLDLLKLLNWERSISAYLLAGWCIVAPICGALNWRPHIWLTGSAGTGKTWVFQKILQLLLGETGLKVEGETSEAGLRQMLGHDSLPVVFDEAEGEDRKAQDRMQSVLALMRAASASNGGVIAKGSAGGSAKTYRIRSCFAFASISVQVAQQSDRTRVTVLGLIKARGTDVDKKWQHLQACYNDLITEDYCIKLRSRTIALLPTILTNIKTFSNAAAAVIGEQRAGDQVGVLLAGAYSLVSDKVIDYQSAVRWVADKDWSEEKGHGATSDEIALVHHLFDQMIRIETQYATRERTLGELVSTALLLRMEWDIGCDHANERIKRNGIKVEGEFIYISNSADWIKKTLAGTAWARNHNKILMRLPTAESVDSARFSSVTTRAVKFHKDLMFKDVVPDTKPPDPPPENAIVANSNLIGQDTQSQIDYNNP